MAHDTRDSAAPSPRFAGAWAALTYALCAFSLSWPALVGQTLIGDPSSDQFRAGYSFREFAATYFKANGSIPLWNPYLNGGLPFVGAMHGDIFYPTFLMRLVMPTDVAITWGLILHFFLCGITAYAFLRVAARSSFAGALIGGIAYMLAGFVSSLVSPGHDGKLFVNALFPVVLLFVWWSVGEGKRWAFGGLAIATGLTLLTPHPQLFEQAMLVAGAWALYLAVSGFAAGPLPRDVQVRRLGAALAMVGIGVAVGAIQYMPAAEYTPWSPRAPGLGYEGATGFSFPIEELVNLYLPQFSGILENYWGRNGIHFHSEYAGAVVLVLVALGLAAAAGDARRSFRRFWLWTGVVSLIWALGRYTPLYNVIYYVVPMAKYMRAPSTMFFVTAFAMAVFAAMGTERVFTGGVNRKLLIGALVAGGVISLLGLLGALTNVAHTLAVDPRLGDRVDAGAGALKLGALRSFVFLAAGIGVIQLIGKGTLKGQAALAVLAIVVAGDLWTVDRLYWSAWGPSAKETFATDPTIEYVKKIKEPVRVLSLEVAGNPVARRDPYVHWDGLMAHGIRQTFGYHGNEIGRYQTFQSQEMELNPSTWALTNTQYLLINADSIPLDGAKRVVGPVANAVGTRVSLFELPGEHPFAWVTPAIAKYPDDAIVQALAAPNFPARSVALIDPASSTQAAQLTSLPPALPITVATTQYAPGRIAVTLSAPAPQGSALVVSENFYPGWNATVDGKPAKAERADLSLMAVALPAGAKSVELTFASATYARGKTITIVASIAALLLTIGGLVMRGGAPAPERAA